MRKLALLIFLPLLIGCNKENLIKQDKGGIDILTNVYFNASKNLDDYKSIVLSKIDYNNNLIIETIPNIDFPEFTDNTFFISIKDSIFYDISDKESSDIIFEELLESSGKSLHKKNRGAIFSKSHLPNFEHRHNLSDTILFNKKYARFEIKGKENYSIFYIYKTDTILPYTMYHKEARKYNGRIERIDSYNIEKDIFVTLQLITRNKWSDEAKSIFEFNNFIDKRKNK